MYKALLAVTCVRHQHGVFPAIAAISIQIACAFVTTRCGQGRMSRGDKYQYSGQWLHDLPHGQGMHVQSNTACFTTKLLQSTLMMSLLRTANAA